MDTSKIIRGVVSSGRYTVTAPIIKEDYGLYLKIEGVELPSTYEVDFSNSESSGTSVTMIGNADGVLIPHQFIETGKDVFAFLYHVGEDFGRTVYKFRIPNKVRPDRTNEEPTPEEQSAIDQAISALNEAVAQTAQDVQTTAQNVSASATNAQTALNASFSASADADRAEQSAADAQESASQASQSATASAQSASQAQGYAQTASAKADAITGLTAQAETLSSGSSATASYDAETGVMSFGIPKGKDGTDGDDGYSPTASVSKSGKVATITITDKDGTTTASVSDGTDGTDYVLTEQDKQDIADLNMPDILKAFPTDTASGAVASFTDGADGLPLKSLVVNIDPVQDLSQGDPSPENICPISGWTQVDVEQSGKNLLPPGDDVDITINGIRFTSDGNGTYTISGMATQNASYTFSIPQIYLPQTVYEHIGNNVVNSGVAVVYLSGSTQLSAPSANAVNRIVDVSSAMGGKSVDNIRLYVANGTSVDMTLSPMLMLDNTATPYEPYQGQQVIIDLGQTVYGGKLDVLSGVLTAEWACVDMGSLTWSYQSLYGRMKTNIPDIEYATSNNLPSGNLMCSIYVDGPAAQAYYVPKSVCVGINSTVGVLVYDDTYTDATSFTTAVTGQTLCYKLATPIEIQLTPHEVRSLLGQNNIFADTGDTEVEYRADPDLYIQRKMPEVPVDDVQIDGTSIVENGVANVPIASTNNVGLVKILSANGVYIDGNNDLAINMATDSQIKNGSASYRPIVPANQSDATFYGLAKASGDTTQSQSSNAVGNYTEDAKIAIQKMLGLYREWELIADVTVEEDSVQIDITTDSSGQSFALREAFVRVWLNPSTTGANDYVSAKMLCEFNNGIVSVGSLPTLRYMANGAKTFMEYKAELIDGIGHAVGSATSSPSTTGTLNRIDNETVDIKHYYGFRIGRYGSSTTLIPAGTIIKIYGIRA